MPIRKLNPKLPRDLETILCKATERNPSDRYQTAAEMATDLARFANSQSLLARRPSRLKAIRNWLWDRPAIAAMALAMLLVFAGSMAMVAIASSNRAASEQKRTEEAQRNLAVGEAHHMLTMAMLMGESNSGLAIALGIEGAKVLPGPASERALMSAVDNNHELQTLPVKFNLPGKIVVSDDGKRVVLCRKMNSDGKESSAAELWALEKRTRLATLKSDYPITAAAFIDNDRYLLTSATVAGVDTNAKANGDETPAKNPVELLALWDAATFKLIRSFSNEVPARISAANYSSTSRQLVVPNADHSATILELPSLSQTMVLPASHQTPVMECRFSPDSNTLATLSQDGVVIVWDAKQGVELQRYKYESLRAQEAQISFTADSKQLCISGDRGTHIVPIGVAEAKIFKRSERLVGLSSTRKLAYLLDSSRHSVVIFNTESRSPICECKSESYIYDAVPLADDQYVALILDEVIAIFDAHTGKQISSLKGHKDLITGVAGIATQPELVSLAWDGTLRHWHVRSDLERRTFPTKVEAAMPTLVSLSPDKSKVLLGTVRVNQTDVYSPGPKAPTPTRFQGDAIVTLANGNVLSNVKGGVALFDATTQRRIKFTPIDFKGANYVTNVIEHSDSNQIALLTLDGELYFWDLNTDAMTQFKPKDAERIKAIALDKNREKLFLSLSSSKLVALNFKDRTATELAALPCPCIELDLSQSGDNLLITGNNGSAYVLELSTAQLTATLAVAGEPIDFAKFVVGDQIVTHGGIGAKSVKLWDKTGKEVDSVQAVNILSLGLDSQRSSVGIAAESGAIYWNLLSNEKTTIEESACRYLAFVQDKVVISKGRFTQPPVGENKAADDLQLMVWDVESKQVVSTHSFDRQVIRILPSGNDGKFIVSSVANGIECMNVETMELVATLDGHVKPLLLAAFGPDANTAITVCEDGKVLEHSLVTGQHTIIGFHEQRLTTAIISGDRRLLLTADQAGKMRSWDLVARKKMPEFATGRDPIKNLSISRDGSTVIGVIDGTQVKLWDLRTGREQEFNFKQGIRQVALSPDSQSIIVVTGRPNLFPGPTGLATRLATTKKFDQVSVIEIATTKSRTLETAEKAIACQYVDGGKKIAVLLMDGTVQVCSATDFEPLYEVKSSRRIMQLMEPPSDKSMIVTASKNQICIWNATDGQLLTEVVVQMPWTAATLQLPNTLFRAATDANYLLMTDRRVFKRPVDVCAYAKKIAPHQLTDEERTFLLRTAVVE